MLSLYPFAPLISGNTPIVTVPASEDEDVAEEVVEDGDEDPDEEDLLKNTRDINSLSLWKFDYFVFRFFL